MKIKIDRTVVQHAIEALRCCYGYSESAIEKISSAITNLSEALVASQNQLDDMAAAQPAPTVPAFNGPAARKLADLQADGWQVNGVHIQRQSGDTWRHGAITAGGMVLWWQPAVRKAALEEAVKLLQSRDMGDCSREDAEAQRCAQAVRGLIEKDPI